MYNYSMKQEKSERKSERKSTPIRALFQLLALLSTCSALYFLYQAQLLPIRLFGFLAIGVLLILALLITLSKRYVFVVILLILDTIINLALSFVFYKYNDYFSALTPITTKNTASSLSPIPNLQKLVLEKLLISACLKVIHTLKR